MRLGAFALLVALLPLPVLADAPQTSLRPLARPVAAAAPAPVIVPVIVPVIAPALRPRPRPVDPNAGLVQPLPPLLPTPAIALRPRPRPPGLAQPVAQPKPQLAAIAPEKSQPGRKKKTARGGYVCGDRDILGETLARITSNVKGCGVAEPVRVSSVDGVRLNPPATLDCDTASALKKWVDRGMRPAFGNRKVVELRIAAHYICRSRNNIKGNKISEHGRGKAIDISGFVFSDGREWSVARDYNKQIRKAHKAACGTFGTTLGPGSDGFHEDHLHFDTAKSRGGPYCR